MVKPAVVKRIVASDQVQVDVLILGATGSTSGVTMRIKGTDGVVLIESKGQPMTPLHQHWTPDAKSLSYHKTPTWVCIIFLMFLFKSASLVYLVVE